VTLTRRGSEVVTTERGSVRAAALPSPVFLRHLVAVNDLRIALGHCLRERKDVELVAFASDRDRAFVGNGRQPKPLLSLETSSEGAAGMLRHVPDAAFLLRRGTRSAGFLAELDLGTEVVGDRRRGVGKAIHFYLNALPQGVRGPETFFGAGGTSTYRVLFLTTSEQRIQNIRRRWGTLPTKPEAVKRFVWLGTLDVLQGNEFLRHPWRSLDPLDGAQYTMIHEREE